jgi:hypothetical protein
MATKFRKIPPICLGYSIGNLLSGKLRYSKQYLGNSVRMPDGQEFTIFRHIATVPDEISDSTYVFIVRFKFARLSTKTNKIISKIPMLLITGFPGFRAKAYALNQKNGYWQGMYEWESRHALDNYKKSFVLGLMNKRALKSTVSYQEHKNQKLNDFIERNSQAAK